MSEKLSNKEKTRRNKIERAKNALLRQEAGELISREDARLINEMRKKYPEAFQVKPEVIDNPESTETAIRVIEQGNKELEAQVTTTQKNINKENSNINNKGLDNTNETTEALEKINQANESATTEQDAVINAAQKEVKTVVGDSNVENSNKIDPEFLEQIRTLNSRLGKVQEEFDKEQKNIENLQVAIQEEEEANSTTKTQEETTKEEAFDSEKAFVEAEGRINAFIDTRAEELKNKIVNGTATGDDFEELDNLENPKPTEPEEDEEEFLKPINLKNEKNEKPKLSIEKTRELIEQEIKQKEEAEGRELTDAEKIDITREIFLAESEKSYKEQQEKAGKFKKFLKKTENWWLGIDDKGNKIEQRIWARSGKVALATIITSVGAFMTGDLTRLATRVGWATGISTLINTALASNKVKEIISGFKKEKTEEEEKDKKLIQKILNVKNLVAATSVGTSFLLAGPLMAIAAGGGIAARELINYYLDKNLPESQERLKELDKEIKKISTTPGNFDINYVLGELERFEKEQKAVEKGMRVNSRIKSLLNTGVTAGVGYVSYEIGAHQHHIENNKAPEIKTEVETKDIPEKTDTVSVDEIPQQEQNFWSKAINKIKNFGQGKKATESIAQNQSGNAEDLKNEEVSEQEDNNGKSEAIDSKKEGQDNNNGESEAKTDNKTEGQNDNSNQKTIKNTEQPTEYKTGDKIDVKNLKPESFIDSQKNVGETYVYRSLIRSDDELAQKLAKYQGLDLEKVGDDRYMANYLRKLAIKLGRMDTEGHEIRYNKEAVDNISLKLDVDKDGKLIAYEIDKAGIVKDVHHEGDTLEKDLESYEEAKLRKTYAEIEKAYDENSGIVAPERTPGYEEQLSNSYSVWEDDSREYLENNYSNNQTNTPDDLSNDEIVAPEKINTNYNFENIKTSSDWENLKGNNLRDFFATEKINMSNEEVRVAESLREFYKKALEASNNDEDFMDFVRNNPKFTIEEATNLYKDVAKEGDFTDTLKEKYNFYEWKESLNPKLNISKQEAEFTKDTLEDKNIEKILKEKYGKNIFKNENFLSNKEVKSIYLDYQKNLKLLDEKIYGDIKSEIAGETVKGYLKNHENSLTDYIEKVKEKLGEAGNPKKGLFGERLDKYLLRVTALAKLKGIDINPKVLLNEDNTQNPNTDNLDEYRPSKKIGDLKKEVLDEYKPYPNSNQEEVKTKDDLDEYKPSKKTQLNDDLNRNN